jgi:hypothetical protein
MMSLGELQITFPLFFVGTLTVKMSIKVVTILLYYHDSIGLVGTTLQQV